MAAPRTEFDAQPVLVGASLRLAPLVAEDFEGLYAAASDPAIWAGHPAKDRHLLAVFRPYFDILLASRATLAIRDRPDDQVIGCSRYYAAPGAEDDIAIGFTFLRRDHWGGAANRELKDLMLNHAFEVFETVWFHIDPANLRSQRATEKIGAVFSHQAELDLSGTPVDWRCYRLSRAAWDEARHRDR